MILAKGFSALGMPGRSATARAWPGETFSVRFLCEKPCPCVVPSPPALLSVRLHWRVAVHSCFRAMRRGGASLHHGAPIPTSLGLAFPTCVTEALLQASLDSPVVLYY